METVTVSIVSGPYLISTSNTDHVAISDNDEWTNLNSRMKINLCGYNDQGTLTNFPLLIVMGEHLADFHYDQFESPTGGDLRFADPSLSEGLDYEIESWDPAGLSYVWVKVPTIATNTDYIWAFWGNEFMTNPPASTTNGAVWSEGYEAVWHLNNEVGGRFLDASTNQNDGVNSGCVDTPGRIAGWH